MGTFSKHGLLLTFDHVTGTVFENCGRPWNEI